MRFTPLGLAAGLLAACARGAPMPPSGDMAPMVSRSNVSGDTPGALLYVSAVEHYLSVFTFPQGTFLQRLGRMHAVVVSA